MQYEPHIIRSSRRTLAVEIARDGRVIVRAPLWMQDKEIAAFLARKSDWIEAHLSRITAPMPPLTAEERAALMAAAKEDIPHRVAHFATLLGISVGRITIRCQRTRWGSCSTKGNVNFNCLLMLCPEDVRDYVVVHELCHRLEMNHSPRFWGLVARILPDYRQHRTWLKTEGRAIMERI